MKVRLFYKIFFLMLLTSSIGLILLSVSSYYLARKNFGEYTDLLRLSRFANISKVIEEHLPPGERVDFFKDKRRLWSRVLFESSLPVNKELDQFRSMRRGRHSPMNSRRFRRFVLLDQNKKRVVGPPILPTRLVTAPIKIGDTIVGYLGTKKSKTISDPLGVNFLKNQLRASVFTGTILIIIVGIIGMIFSAQITVPIKKLIVGTKQLAKGKLNTRIEVKVRDEIGQLAESFNEMSQALENSEKKQRNWISDISHELGTPLSILRGEVEALQDGIRPLDQKRLSSLHSEVMLINSIVNDLRDISIAETDHFTYVKEIIDLKINIENVIDLFKKRLDDEKITVENKAQSISGQLLVSADSSKITQVLSNIVDNAIKYAGKNSVIEFSYEVLEKQVKININDSGPSVSSEKLDHLFDRFYKENEKKSSLNGRGLGLSICKAIVNAHGGEISAFKGHLGGLQISITLPKNLS